MTGSDVRLTGPQAAARAGVRPATWRDYTAPKASRGGRVFGPAPDGREELSGRPWWWRSSVDAWLASRGSSTGGPVPTSGGDAPDPCSCDTGTDP